MQPLKIIQRTGLTILLLCFLQMLACSSPPPICSEERACEGGAVCVSGSCVCPDNMTLCGSTCVYLVTDRKNCGTCGQECPTDQACTQGLCQCPASQSLCHGTCTDTRNSSAHCGRCGVQCQNGERCVEGRCLTSCPPLTPTLCGGNCVDLKVDALHCGQCKTACPGGQLCQQGKCTCPSGYRDCSGVCIDLRHNNQNCGECDKKCASGSSCSEGRCVTSCPKTTPSLCYGSCIDTQTSDQNCGQCGNSCRLGQRCLDGACQCPPGKQECNGHCVDVRTQSKHCGVCGNQCAKGKVCAEGRCVSNCPKGTEKACFGGCFELKNNVNHCGKCGNQCPGLQLCNDGKCQCAPGLLFCDGKCIDPKTDPIHCGKCTNVCPSGEVCAAGKCATSCPKTTPAICFGGCFDTKSSNAHCGQCGQSCTGGKRCNAGKCQCPAGQSSCGGVCTDTKIDRLNCGGCGKFCQTGERCDAGVCQLGCGLQIACGGVCVEPQTDDRHCGKCDNACSGDKRCVDGDCKCTTGRIECNSLCIDPKTDSRHCGQCGTTCSGGKICQGGSCILICQDKSQTACSNGCFNLQRDNENCGACGNKCSIGQGCVKGSCVCAANETKCSGNCVNTKIDVKHCGSCGNACATGSFCLAGICKKCSSAAPLACGNTCCRVGQQCCGSACVDPLTDNGNCGSCGAKCAAGQQCTAGSCICTSGQTRSCYTGPNNTSGKGLCRTGTATCTGGKWGSCVNQILPQTEKCDGKDNDCDGQIDETWPLKNSPCSVGKGACWRKGKQRCNKAQTGLACDAKAGLPQIEVCDKKDNDCDGLIDESIKKICYTGPTFSRRKGECKDGISTCINGIWGSCVGQITPKTEVCDKKDNDCDGKVDSLARVCYTGPTASRNKGVCQDGGQLCINGVWGSCVGQIIPKTETCNKKDDDCDGQIDESIVGGLCPKQKGICAGKRVRCVNGAFQACTNSTTSYGALFEATETKCDGKDNDCDGLIDESLNKKGPLCSKQKGLCAGVRKSCKSGAWAACGTADYGLSFQAGETRCDGRDNDCDGLIDEGCKTCTLSKLLRTVTLADGPHSVAISPDESTFSIGNRYNINVFNLKTGASIRLIANYSLSWGIQYSPRDPWLSSGGGSFKLFDILTGKRYKNLPGHTSGVTDSAFNNQGNRLVSASNDKTLIIHDMDSFKNLYTLKKHTGYVTSVAWSLNDQYIVSGDKSKTINVWSGSNGQHIRTIIVPTRTQVSSVAINPTGLYIASISDDKTLRLWNRKTGLQMWSKVLTNISYSKASVAFRWDSKQIAVAQASNIDLYDIAGKFITTLKGHSGSVQAIAWGSSGKILVSTSTDKTAKVWSCP